MRPTPRPEVDIQTPSIGQGGKGLVWLRGLTSFGVGGFPPRKLRCFSDDIVQLHEMIHQDGMSFQSFTLNSLSKTTGAYFMVLESMDHVMAGILSVPGLGLLFQPEIG